MALDPGRILNQKWKGCGSIPNSQPNLTIYLLQIPDPSQSDYIIRITYYVIFKNQPTLCSFPWNTQCTINPPLPVIATSKRCLSSSFSLIISDFVSIKTKSFFCLFNSFKVIPSFGRNLISKFSASNCQESEKWNLAERDSGRGKGRGRGSKKLFLIFLNYLFKTLLAINSIKRRVRTITVKWIVIWWTNTPIFTRILAARPFTKVNRKREGATKWDCLKIILKQNFI